MPIEFSVAAFRLGHSMIRADYNWNKHFPDATLDQLFDFSGLMGDLGAGTRSRASGSPTFAGSSTSARLAARTSSSRPSAFNRAMRIDTKLVTPLRTLPVPDPEPRKNLAFRNLLRANMVRLATGQQMVTFLKNKGAQPDEADQRADPGRQQRGDAVQL